MNLIQLFQTYGIDYAESGNKHCTKGWVNVHCPFCVGSRNYHLGFHLTSSACTCWRCGKHSSTKALSKILGITESKARQLLAKYNSFPVSTIPAQDDKIKFNPYKRPEPHFETLQANHKRYLMKRGFDPDKLKMEWNVMGTGPISFLRTGEEIIDYKHRLLIPIFWNEKEVSFQTRDITDKSYLKYITCPKNREIVHHKHILYGKQEKWNDVGICVEGIFDVWRFGEKAFATFGIEFTNKQIRVIANNFKRVFVVFDDEDQAQEQAEKLMNELVFRGIEAYKKEIKGDPGSMPQEEADYFVKQLI